ncbi:unnamed protein product [Arabidopsis halleri]
MDNLNVFANEDNQVDGVKPPPPPPRVCPRCDSDNTKFCYYNNYSESQPRYFCKNCRRYWTHGGALRNIPIGGSCRKPKRPKVDQSLVSEMVSVENRRVDHQPFKQIHENNEFVRSFGVGNHFGYLSELHGVTNFLPVRSFRTMDCLDFGDDAFQQDYLDVGSNYLIGNPLINQSIGGYVDNLKSYRINQVDQHRWNQSFNNTMNMNHKANASGSR